ncbi:Regulator of chromosome condensation (RCC1) repeat protein [Grimontia celer]|uniref:Regulator of chromosome condensation (RCC1) repeat protein n=1 Tax=Grimontia celer TaxID=1796497 RepID=A0A128EZY3_9GAMM|nr:hypothetical protein [Grimontia celer]CZF79581.1 Regulator of chromosome condensation (RCC1) repeat protein [Grimontia celer]
MAVGIWKPAVLASAVAALAGCPALEQGKLDIPVEGLSYQSGFYKGTTGEGGTFYYLQGEKIRFSVDGMRLKKVKGAEHISLADLTKEKDLREEKALTLLKAFIADDADGDMYTGLSVEPVKGKSKKGKVARAELKALAEKTGDAKAYAYINWATANEQIQMAAGNHHTLGLSQGGRPFSFGENYGGFSYGEDPNRYCEGAMRTKLGRASDLYLPAGTELVTEPRDGLTEAEGECYIELQNQRLYGLSNPASAWVDISGVSFKSISTDQIDGTMVTEDGRLFVFGPNNRGQLGLGNENTTDAPVEVTLPDGELAAYATSGSASAYVVTQSGKVYSSGDNGNLQLGRVDDKDDDQNTFGLVDIPSDEFIVHVAIRDHHVFALTAEGDVYSWGNNARGGELGDGTVNEDRSEPQKILEGMNIIYVETGADYGLAVDAEGIVYGWGSNDYGALAQGTPEPNSANTLYKINDITSIPTPEVLTALSPENLGGDRIIAFQGGSRNAHALTLGGDVYSWGDMGTGYAGNGYEVDELGIERQIAVKPVKLEALDELKVVQLSSNTSSHFAVTDEGDVWAWGATTDGKIGVPEDHCAASNIEEYGEGASSGTCYTPFLLDALPQE